jgi:uncharacterized repeat protein (TIGR01451 family)
MSTTQSARFFRPRPYAECIIGPNSVLPLTSPLGGSVVMGHCADLEARHRAVRRLCAAVLGLAAIFSLPLSARAQDTAIMTRGDAAVTAFSGARQIGEVPADLHPLDLTFIDVNGATLQVFDLTALGGGADGQVANAPIKFKATAGEIGQVFGVALDGDTANATPNIYVTSTSLFGLQIVAANGDRLVKGEPGARWMPGQFGLDKGGTPGSVWKIDGVTGLISLFANIEHDGKANAGPGLGAITYDPATKQLFVSDLETGLIHRLDLDGNDRGTYDHGTAGRPKDDLEPVPYDAAGRMSIESPSFDIENPSTWGVVDKRRAVFAVAVQGERLYYSTAEGPQIWSVGLDDDGSFADDARLEIEVTDTPKGNVITGIVFDGAGALYLAQRGVIVGSYDYSVFAKPEASNVLRYVWDETDQRWSENPGEYAIGLKPPHRSTAGGIALNYGYDPDGNIDYDQCRATLWTTGEHLREGTDENRVFAGGARIIHGLQGGDMGTARPSNEPPYDAWFVDNDGLYLDADVYGHVGDIAIFNPCDKRTVAEPEPLPFPWEPSYTSAPPYPEDTPPDLSEPGIYIDKECFPGIIGGEIHCVITLTNVGETPSDPIDMFDSAIAFGGGGVTITGVTPDGPDWICSPTPTPDLWCSLPPDALDPGETRSIDVFLDTGPLFAGGSFGFLNCAEVEAPWHDVACDEGGTDITVTKTAPAACLPGADCTFTVTIANTGAFPFSGDVQFTDAMFLPDGTALLPPIAGIVPALGCVPAPAGLAFSCTAPLTLGPGESIAFAITVTMPPAPPAYWAQNCFAVSAPGAVPPALPLAPGADSNMVSCAWVPVGGPPPLSNLRMDKRALNGGACYKLPGDIIGCDYEVEITNDGPSTFGGVVVFLDEFPAGPTGGTLPPGWGCFAGAAAFACGVAPAPPIPAGGSITAPFTLTIPLATLEAAGCALPNTATIFGPAAGTDENFFGGDDADTATADAFLEWELPGGAILVTCDPTNLKTTKVAKGDCVASDGGYRCDYVVTVTNMGEDPHNGQIVVDEQFSFAPSSVKFSPEWHCPKEGGVFHCTHPPVHLEKGESVELKVSATVPDGPHCKLRNTAHMTVPEANTRFNGDPVDDIASATTNIPSKNCKEPDRLQCEPKTNELRSESGACVCKSGYVRDQKGLCVGLTEPPVTEPPVTEPSLCPDGKPVPKSGRCPSTPPQPQCGPNEERNTKGQCVCLEGFERDQKGRCVEEETPIEEENPEDECEDKGWLWDDKRDRCVPPTTEPEEPAEPAEPSGPTGPIACKPGKDEVRNAQGQCVCKKGYDRDRYGRCVAPTPHCTPGPNEERNAQDQCVCKKGYERDKNGRCVAPIDPERECKAKGWFWDGKRCLTPADACKAKGWVWNDKRKTCSPPTSPADECKQKGWVWNDKRKSCSPPPNPADECKAKGWVWNDKRKSCSPPPNPADKCKAKGWVWNDKRKSCSPRPNPADECKAKGWVWNDKRKSCSPRPNPADECKAKGWVWDGKSCKPPAASIVPRTILPR